MLNPAGQITSWNTGAERLFYYQESEIIEQSLSLLFTEADRAGAYEAELETARQTGQAADERWHQRKDASLFWASGMLTAIYSRCGRWLRP